MQYTSDVKDADSEVVRNEVSKGRPIIPANINHLNLDPIGIGIPLRTQVNANVGSPSIVEDIDEEVEKLKMSMKYADCHGLKQAQTWMQSRESMTKHSTIPIGTVPMHQILKDAKNDVTKLNKDVMINAWKSKQNKALVTLLYIVDFY